jgi:hypothetical protein
MVTPTVGEDKMIKRTNIKIVSNSADSLQIWNWTSYGYFCLNCGTTVKPTTAHVCTIYKNKA